MSNETQKVAVEKPTVRDTPSYFDSLSLLREALAQRHPDLPMLCEMFAARCYHLSTVEICEHWDEYFTEINSTINVFDQAICNQLNRCQTELTKIRAVFEESEFNARLESEKLMSYARLDCANSAAYGAAASIVLSPLDTLVSIFTLGWSRKQREKRIKEIREAEREKAKALVEERVEKIRQKQICEYEKRNAERKKAESVIKEEAEQLGECLSTVREAQESLKVADVDVPCIPTLPNSPVALSMQKVVANANQALTKMTVKFAMVMKINNSAPITLAMPEVEFDITEKIKNSTAPITVNGRSLEWPGSQKARHTERCQHIIDSLEAYRKRIRKTYRNELELGITKHLSLPSVQEITDWIQVHRDPTATRRIIDRVLFNALGTSVDSYNIMLNIGRQKAQEIGQAKAAKPDAQKSDKEPKIKNYEYANDLERLNPRIIMYWQKLPTDCAFVLMESKPPLSKAFNRVDYVNALRRGLLEHPLKG